MADDSTVSQQRPLGQRLKHGVESKILVPVAAGIVTIAVKYLLKKLPMILEEKVLPKLAEKGAPSQVSQVVEGTAAKLGDGDDDGAGRVEAAAEQQEPSPAKTPKTPKTPDPSDSSDTSSNGDREAERRKREQRRQQRKRDLEKAS